MSARIRSFLTLLLAGLCLVLTACGGGDPADDEAMLEPAAAAVRYEAGAVAPIKVLMYGDSTQVGINDQGVNPASVAQAIFDHREEPFQVRHEGVGGSSALQLLLGVERVHTQPFLQAIAATDADIVTFRFGINDRRNYSAKVFLLVMEELVSLAEAAGKTVIIETPSPIERADILEEVQANVRVLRFVASRHPAAVLCDHNEVGYSLGFETIDRVHPTVRDYRLRQGRTAASCMRQAARKRGVLRG